jgi:hypothetical protein
MEGFAGKVAVVTGAGSGIGQALAIELARSGARVAEGDPFGGPVAMRLGVGGSWSTVERTRLG